MVHLPVGGSSSTGSRLQTSSAKNTPPETPIPVRSDFRVRFVPGLPNFRGLGVNPRRHLTHVRSDRPLFTAPTPPFPVLHGLERTVRGRNRTSGSRYPSVPSPNPCPQFGLLTNPSDRVHIEVYVPVPSDLVRWVSSVSPVSTFGSD